MIPFDRPPMTSYRRSMALSGVVSEINCDFSRKLQIFPTPCILRSRWRVPLELGIGAGGQKTRLMGLPGRESLTISLTVWIQYINVTDGQTYTGRQQRPRLRLASCGKNAMRGNDLRGIVTRPHFTRSVGCVHSICSQTHAVQCYPEIIQT